MRQRNVYIEGSGHHWYVSSSAFYGVKGFKWKPFKTLRAALEFARSLDGCVWQCKN